MNWHFFDDGTVPKDLQECVAIESRERSIVPCYWVAKEKLFHVYDNNLDVFYLGEFEDYDNYVLAWIPIDDIIDDYFSKKSLTSKKNPTSL